MAVAKKPVPEAGSFITLSGVKTSLEQNISAHERVLPIPMSQTLRNALKGGRFTFMSITSPTDYEVVKVYEFDGKLRMERGQDDTQATGFPKGSCVDAGPTWAGIKELICTLDCCEDQ